MVPKTPPQTPESSNSGTPAPVGDPLEDVLTEIHSRIAALESESRNKSIVPPVRWYKEPATLVSVLALVFSIIATLYTSREASNQNARAARAELGQLVQRLSALPKENADLIARYADNRAVLTSLSGSINSENLVLAQQAADVIDRIPDQVSGSEFLAVAIALELSGTYPRSLELIERGLRVDKDPTSEEGMLRLKAKILFGAGDIKGGRAQLRYALGVWKGASAQERGRGNAYTELTWSGLERQAGNCQEALIHFNLARQAMGQLSEGPWKRQLAQNLQAGPLSCDKAG